LGKIKSQSHRQPLIFRFFSGSSFRYTPFKYTPGEKTVTTKKVNDAYSINEEVSGLYLGKYQDVYKLME